MIVVDLKIQSQLVGQFLFPDMSLVIRYSRRWSDSQVRRICAIQEAINLLNVMFRWIQLLGITGQRCNDDFTLVITQQRIKQSWRLTKKILFLQRGWGVICQTDKAAGEIYLTPSSMSKTACKIRNSIWSYLLLSINLNKLFTRR